MTQDGERRQGRGRLSRLDMLPEEAQEHLTWLNTEIRAKQRPLNELRDVFNVKLVGLGIEPISNGSFSRYAVRKAIQFKELDETLRMSRELAEVLGSDGSDQLTINLSNMLQVAAVKLMEAEGSQLAAKDLMELARAAQAATSAQKQSADYRRMLEREFAQKVEAAKKDIEQIGKKAGVSDEVMLRITNKLSGLA